MRRDPSDGSFNEHGTDPIRIVPATPDRFGDDPPTAQMPQTPGTYEPTVVMPAPAAVVPPAMVVPQAVAAAPVYAEPVYSEPVYVAPPPRRWGAVAAAALLALLIGGIVGLLIGRASAKSNTLTTADTQPPGTVAASDQGTVDKRVNDIFTLLVAESKQPGGITTPTPYPQLDQLLGILKTSAAPTTTAAPAPTTDPTAATVSGQVATLQQQNAALQEQLTAAQKQRDDLQATLNSSGSATSDLQRQADQQAQRINQLQSDLNATKTQLATAQDTLTKLNPMPIDNLVGMDIAQVRSLAKTNGWTLVEKTVDNTGATPNAVTAQMPAAGSTMINGGVLYVEVARKA